MAVKVIMQDVIKVKVIVLSSMTANVIMPSVVAPKNRLDCGQTIFFNFFWFKRVKVFFSLKLISKKKME